MKKDIKKTISFLVISSNKTMNHLMRAADVFESGKVLGSIHSITLTVKPGKRITWDYLREAQENLKKSLEEAGQFVSFVFLEQANDGQKKLSNRQLKVLPFWDKTVRAVSDGEHWTTMQKLLNQLGFNVETDQNLFITKIY